MISRVTGIIAVVSLCVFTLCSGISHAGLTDEVNNKHNLSVGGPGGFTFATFQVCVFCHTPHGANTSVHLNTFYNATTDPATYDNTAGTGSLVLWNRALANATSGNGYDTYQSSTMHANTGQVRAYSLLCLSCHDGVSAMNVLTSPPGDDNVNYGVPAMDPLGGADQIGDIACFVVPGVPCANIGGRVPGSDSGLVNLADDHPISFDYDTALATADGGLATPDNTLGEVGNTVKLKLYPNPAGELKSLECSTCHDPHNYGTGSQVPFLEMSNANSDLCTNCHNK